MPSVPVRCIEVDSRFGMCLAGDSLLHPDTQQLRSAGSGCSSTRRPGSSTPASTATSRSSCPTWPTLPITIYPGMKIGQISFLRMTTPADQPYGSRRPGSKYQGQRGPTPSRYFENFPTS